MQDIKSTESVAEVLRYFWYEKVLKYQSTGFITTELSTLKYIYYASNSTFDNFRHRAWPGWKHLCPEANISVIITKYWGILLILYRSSCTQTEFLLIAPYLFSQKGKIYGNAEYLQILLMHFERMDLRLVDKILD